uniref:GRIP domain-containing protein n=1 Tax=Panagrolaimus superbus TaxID=310955 RepID=A0A914Y168_9BILA
MPSPTNGFKRENVTPPGRTRLTGSTPSLSSPSSNAITTLLSNASMNASFPSTSDTNYFITPAIGRHRFSPSSSASVTPKKSILKRSSFPLPTGKVAFESPFTTFATNALLPPSRNNNFEQQKNNSNNNNNNVSRIPKPSVGFSEKNTVAIFGDTSDDNTTENESLAQANSRIPIPATNPLDKLIRQTSILYSEDEDTDSPSQPAGDSHDGTDYEDDTATEDLENVVIVEEKKENGGTDDGDISYTSSTASSLVTSKWWFGKETKYVTHCDKNGCNHKHHKHQQSPPGAYLTPTQQKSKEINKLKKELKGAKSVVEEKERHLRELRDRVKEIENVMDTNSALREHSRLMQRQKEIQDEYKAEKQQMIEKHEIRVRQLIQEAVDARADALRRTEQLEQFHKLKRQNYVDSSTNTDPPKPPPSHAVGLQAALASLAPSPQPDDGSTSEQHHHHQQQQQVQAAIAQDAVNQLQAYQNEAIIWRTKAAQLEIVVKEQLSKASTTEAILANDLEAARIETERLRDYCHRLEAAALADSICDGDRLDTAAMIRSIDSSSRATPANQQLLQSPSSVHLVLAAECQSPACLERTRLLGEENKQLYESLQERAGRIHELEEAVTDLRQSGEDMIFEMEDLKEQQQRLAQLAEERNAECEAAQIILSRLQDEKEQLNQALLFLEERTKVYRNTILDNDLVVRDEGTSEWHRGFIDPRFQILVSKQAQTDLTSDELKSNEREFVDLREKLREIQAEFSSKHKTLHEKFNEIEENLILKTNLVESLSRQLDSAQDEIQQSLEQRQKERETYQQRINNLAKTGERIPFLEAEHERMKSEKSLLERRFEEMKEEYEDGLGAALDGTLRKYKEQTLYWQEKVSKLEQSRNLAKAENEKYRKDLELIKMKNYLNKADLENRLTSSIDHVTILHNQVNVPRRDAQCDARPKTNSKYVSCKPNVKEKETQIFKGELFDEIEERLKLTKVELSVTKRQVQVLQQKMLEGTTPTTTMNNSGSHGRGSGDDRDTTYQGTPRPSPFRSTVSPIGTVERNSSFMFSVFDHSINNEGRNFSIAETEDIEDLKENISQLEERNTELSTKLRHSEAVRNEQIRAEKERLQQIFNEFDNVRKELDEEIKKYESERMKMKEKIQKLEQQKDESDKLKAKIRQWNKLHRLLAPRISATSDSNDENEIEKAIEKMHHSMFSAHPIEENNSEEELKRSASFPALLITSADSDSEIGEEVLSETDSRKQQPKNSEKAEELNETKLLSAELSRLKAKVEQSIRRTVSQNSATTSGAASGSLSPLTAKIVETSPIPAFAEFSTDLEQVQAELEKLLISMETPPTVTSTVTLDDSKLEKITVENERIKKAFTELKSNYDEAARELDMYRNETAAAVLDRKDNPRFPRSNSSENLINTSVTPQELQRWKETAGTTFREVNRLRKNCAGLENDRRELKTQVAILKGEIELAKAQNQLNKELTEVSRRGSFQSHKSKRQRKSTDRKARTQSLSTTTGSYATANYSFASMDVLLSNSEPNIFDQWNSSEQININSMNEKKHSLEIISKVNPEDELSIVQEAFQKQVSALKTRNAELEKLLASKNSKLIRQPLSRSQEAIAPLPNPAEKQQEEKLAILEREVKLYEKKIREMDDERQTMNLVMFQKGQQAAKHDLTEEKRIDEMTEDRIVLKFLHDAFYYYLLNRGNTREHLNAIMTMLNFTSSQKDEVCKRRGNSH